MVVFKLSPMEKRGIRGGKHGIRARKREKGADKGVSDRAFRTGMSEEKGGKSRQKSTPPDYHGKVRGSGA